MTDPTHPRRGRPPMDWMTGDQLRALPTGTAVAVETTGRHRRLLGRLAAVTGDVITLDCPLEGQLELGPLDVKRGRQVPALYEPGDPVLLRGRSADEWRGGVVRTTGTEVLVEQLDGAFAWHDEAALEPPEARDQKAPGSRRGPVPTRI